MICITHKPRTHKAYQMLKPETFYYLMNNILAHFDFDCSKMSQKGLNRGNKKAEKLHKKKHLEEQQDRGSLINTHIYKLQNNFRIRIINIKL